MNIANKITLLRILLIPIFIVFLMINKPFYREIALLIFIIASLTDKLDGYYARKLNLIIFYYFHSQHLLTCICRDFYISEIFFINI
jgi:type IV secretory pathway VirB3-like protein